MRNFVSKHMNTFNKSVTMIDRKRDIKLNGYDEELVNYPKVVTISDVTTDTLISQISDGWLNCEADFDIYNHKFTLKLWNHYSESHCAMLLVPINWGHDVDLKMWIKPYFQWDAPTIISCQVGQDFEYVVKLSKEEIEYLKDFLQENVDRFQDALYNWHHYDIDDWDINCE